MNETLTTEKIWRDFSAQLRGFIRARVRDEAEADDLLQETFLKIHTRLPQLRNHDLLAPWIYRIARNTLMDHYRARPTREGVELAAEIAAPPGNRLENDDSGMNQLVGLWLRGFLATMPEEYRQAVEMVELEGKTMEELAVSSGLSVSGAKSRVQRGRRMLRQRLHDCCHVELDRRGNVLGVKANRCCGEFTPPVRIAGPRRRAGARETTPETRAPHDSRRD